MSEEIEQITKSPTVEKVSAKEKDPKKVAAGKKLAEHHKKAREALARETKREAEAKEAEAKEALAREADQGGEEEGTNKSAHGWIPELSFTTVLSLVGIGITALDMFMRYRKQKPDRVNIPQDDRSLTIPLPSKIPVPSKIGMA